MATTVNYFPPAASGASDDIAYWKAAGLQRLNLTANQVVCDSSDFLETASASNVFWTIAGTVTQPASLKGGVLQMNTAGTSSIIRPTTYGQLARATTAFYFYTRFKCASTPTGGQLGIAGLVDTVASAQGFFIGALGPSNTGQDGTHYGAYTYDGATVTGYPSTIAIDTSYHDFETWYDGTTYKFSVDNESPITISGNLPANTKYLYAFFEGNGARTYQWDTFVALSSRE